MTLNVRIFAALFYIFGCFFLDILEISNGIQDDIDCLKSIKDSFEDPYNYLNSSWDFNNNTEGFICKFTGVECWDPNENRFLNLRLSYMGLRGQFPRGIENCKRLTGGKLFDPQNSQLEGQVTRVNFTELNEASNNFSTDNTIGPGKIGVMYKAMLPNGSLPAVKRLHDCQSFEKQFKSELLALGRLRHNNTVPSLGFCREREEKLLVYQYISNDNLYDWLQAREGNDKILEWPLRIKIAIGIARGLVWLHYKRSFQVVHLKFKLYLT
ncbi:putativeinactive leucine-rich repeat receptor-like protein kinase [Quercus suber]|uniref:Putativeinactive leucine-rich repeat receptor-like protein kinase n=1 Tax=Quercus suber TaxID=58331 RepID=A0AAW0K2L2_QUESU